MKKFAADENGYFGEYGGAFIPETLQTGILELQQRYQQIIDSEEFQKEYKYLLKHYVGRPSPLYRAERMCKKYNTNIYLKREDLNHTGSHKINNTIGQILLAKTMGKSRIIAETGAGQHGVATATVCALMDMECTIYMGQIDIERQYPNVEKIKLLGASVIPATSGSMTLKDAVNEAIGDWCANPEHTFYIIGSVVGPHPYPDMVAKLQSVISEETKFQLEEQTGSSQPNYLIACIGGGSNAAGSIYHYLDDEEVNIVLAEAAGLGVQTGQTAATLLLGTPATLHGSRTYIIQGKNGEEVESYSISAGLNYPGVGPMFAHLLDKNRITPIGITDSEAIEGAFELTKLEGIIPAMESAHAIAALKKIDFKPTDVVVVTISGRGDKDMETYLKHINKTY